jgi:hypothetical protein
LDQRFAIVTDIANAAKHIILDQNRSRTNLYGSANTEVQEIHGGHLGAAPLVLRRSAAPQAASS